ncbi:MAG TPA: copper transporter, partial [Nakamurella sp.]|nr:copper transporter [Nakamurella sp.]
DPADRDAVLSLLNRAGATVTAQIQVTKDFTDPARADELRSLAAKSLPTGATLPEVPQVGAVAGGLLGSVIVVKPDGSGAPNPDQAAAALAALTSGGFVSVTGTPAPGSSVVILTGGAVTGGSEADRAAAVADLASQLKKSATGVVVAGRTGSEGETGVVGVIRSDTAATAAVTTVDNLDTSSGRLAAVLGLVEQNGGGVGRYGLAENAQAQVPTLAVG